MTKTGPIDIMSYPGFLIRRCNQIAMAIFLDETAKFDLTPAQYGALVLIAREPGMDQTQLMARLALDRSSIAKCVERLEKRGAIVRTIAEADRRARHLDVTAEGAAMVAAMEEQVTASQNRILAPLGEEKAQQLMEMLAILAKAHNDASRAPMGDTAAD